MFPCIENLLHTWNLFLRPPFSSFHRATILASSLNVLYSLVTDSLRPQVDLIAELDACHSNFIRPYARVGIHFNGPPSRKVFRTSQSEHRPVIYSNQSGRKRPPIFRFLAPKRTTYFVCYSDPWSRLLHILKCQITFFWILPIAQRLRCSCSPYVHTWTRARRVGCLTPAAGMRMNGSKEYVVMALRPTVWP